MKKSVFVLNMSFLILSGFFFFINFYPAFAEEIPDTAVSSEAVQTEIIVAADLGVSEPRILPDSKFYFFKEWARGVSEVFSFGATAKAEKRLQHANERLIEAQKLFEKTGNEELAARAIEKYQETAAKVQEKIEEAKSKGASGERFENLMDKFTSDTLKQEQLITKIQNRVASSSPEVKEKIKEIKENVMERLGDTLNSVDGTKIEERINRVVSTIKDGEIKSFEIFEKLKSNSSIGAEVKEKLNTATERTLQKIEKLEDANAIQKLEQVKTRLQEKLPESSNAVDALRKIIEQKRERTENRICAQVLTPARDQNGNCKIFPTSCLAEGWTSDVTCKTDLNTSASSVSDQ